MLAVIRVRGSIDLKPALKHTMKLLMLICANQLVLVSEKQLPMLKKVEAFVTWGEVSEEIIENILKKRGRIAGNKKISPEFLKTAGFSSIKDLAKSVSEGKVKLKPTGIKPVFRLTPPKKGFGRKGIKKPYSLGGALGYRAADINDLILRMI